MTRDLMIEQIKRHEWDKPIKNGRMMPYEDTKHILTIGYGRNLSANGVRVGEAEEMLNNDVDEAIHACFQQFPWFRSIDTVRQAVITELVFNMGMPTWLQFVNTIAAIEGHNFPAAAEGLRQSKWFKDVKKARGEKLSKQMESGLW